MQDRAEFAIQARGLTRRFGALVAVNNVDLDVPSGRSMDSSDLTAPASPQLSACFAACSPPARGQARVLGLDARKDSEALKQQIGYMTQRFSLYDDLSVRENLQFIGEIYAIARRERRRRVAELISRFNLAGRERQRAGTLSGGQRQRLALAAATLHRPRLLLLDEPTSAVDPRNRRDFWEILFELAEQGTTILVSTHYMDEAIRCHNLAILDRGIKVADGSPRSLGENIPTHVIEVLAESVDAAHMALTGNPQILSLTRLGSRLRVQIPNAVPDPIAVVESCLRGAGIAARVNHVVSGSGGRFCSGYRIARPAVRRHGRGMEGTPTGMQGTPTRMEGTPTRMEGTPT